jgi:hypothetical protein
MHGAMNTRLRYILSLMTLLSELSIYKITLMKYTKCVTDFIIQNVVNFKLRFRSQGKFGRGWPARYAAGLHKAQSDPWVLGVSSEEASLIESAGRKTFSCNMALPAGRFFATRFGQRK